MEIISFEKKTFEEISAKLDYFVQRMETLCNSHDQKETGKWDGQSFRMQEATCQSENITDFP